jgi:hypothetical protein
MRRLAAAASVTLAGLALHAPCALAAETPASAEVQGLAERVREAEPWEVGALVRSEPRFSSLAPEDRRLLLGTLEEPVKLWAPLLNFYPGYGIGSLAQGDRRGLWTAGLEVLATVGFMVGLIGATGDDFRATPEERDRSKRQSRTIALVSLGALAATRTVSICLPFSFRGARHAALDRALSSSAEPAHAAAWVAPGAGGGLSAGVALAF